MVTGNNSSSGAGFQRSCSCITSRCRALSDATLSMDQITI